MTDNFVDLNYTDIINIRILLSINEFYADNNELIIISPNRAPA